jgi:flagellar biosynthesis protein FlhA
MARAEARDLRERARYTPQRIPPRHPDVATPAPPSSSFADVIARLRNQGDIVLAAALGAFLVIMVMPMPALALDLLLSASISSGLLILLVTIYIRNPTEFSVFPMVLLATTLFRLSLNVASTRRILLFGSEGTDAAGNVIETFGQIVVGGSYIVGLVVFIILVIINFVVITKGAGRIAEVAARFTLDAMPGKQMAIDAELNAGVINEVQARARRDAVTREADFYGSMDGASKFIRGDAIAGIVITLVNIIGGILIGVVQEDMSLAGAAQRYTVLTIGDGLVGQVPALIISAAAGMLVTRVNDSEQPELHSQFAQQLFGSNRAMALLSFSLFGFALLPGLRIPFIVLGTGAGVIAWRNREKPKKALADEGPDDVDRAGRAGIGDDQPVESLLRVEPLAIELGVDLISLVDERRGGNLVERIQRIRRQLAQDLGLLVPAVHLRDNLRLDGGEYRVLLRGEDVARGKVYVRQLLAINPGDARGEIKGVAARDPVFGLDAAWIPEAERLRAQTAGYTVVDVPTVLTTHLTEVLNLNGHELFSRQHLADVLDRVQTENPRLVEDLIPDMLTRGAVLRVFRNLLREGVSIRDAQTVLEALADHASRVRDPDVLTEFVRQRLARHITRRFGSDDGVLHYIGLAPDAEDAISSGLHAGDGGSMNLTLDPNDARKLLTGLRDAAERWRGSNDVVVLCPPLARGPLRRLTEKVIPRVPVVSPAELLPEVRLERVAAISLRNSGA